MIEKKCTPTPWAVSEDGKLGHIIDANGDAIAQTQQRLNDPRHVERQANAILIARAVNSHEYLIEALRGLRRNNRCWCQTWVGGEHEPECAAAIAALAIGGGKN